MELRQLQYFIIVSQEQSFSKAAKKAYVSQQAISKAIQGLEDELNVKLFIRHPYGVELTGYGQMLLKKAYVISNSVNEIPNGIRLFKDNIQNIIPIEISSATSEWIDIKKLLAFREKYPQYRITVVSKRDKDIENDIIDEKIELGLMGAKGTTDKLEFTALTDTNTYLVVNRENPLAEKTSVVMTDLKDSSFIIGSDDFYGCNHVKTLCNAMGFSPNIAHETVCLELIFKLLSIDEGIFLCNERIIPFITDKNLRCIPIMDNPKFYNTHLAVKKNAQLSKGAELLKEYIEKKFKE